MWSPGRLGLLHNLAQADTTWHYQDYPGKKERMRNFKVTSNFSPNIFYMLLNRSQLYSKTPTNVYRWAGQWVSSLLIKTMLTFLMVKVNILCVFKSKYSTFFNSINPGVRSNMFISIIFFIFYESYAILEGPKLHKTVLNATFIQVIAFDLIKLLFFQNGTVSLSPMH